MPDPLTHLIHFPAHLAEPELCEECQADQAEANGTFLAERSEARHLAWLDTLSDTEREAMVDAAMALGDYLDECIDAYSDAHPDETICYGLVHEALRFLYWRSEREMLDDEDDDADDEEADA